MATTVSPEPDDNKQPISAAQVKDLRDLTGAPMMDCKKALTEANGDTEKAIIILRKRGAAVAQKKAARVTSEGSVAEYIHAGGKIGVLVEVNCESDFVARTDDFKDLGKALAEHIAAASPIAVDKDMVPAEKIESERRIFVEQVMASGKPENMIDKIVEGKIEAYYRDVCLLQQMWVRDPKKSIGDLVKEVAAKTGENIKVRRFVRYQLGEI